MRTKIAVAALSMGLALAYFLVPLAARAMDDNFQNLWVIPWSGNHDAGVFGSAGNPINTKSVMSGKIVGSFVACYHGAGDSGYQCDAGYDASYNPIAVTAAGVVPISGTTTPAIWRVNSNACLIVSVNSAGPDAGSLLAPDGGVPVSGTLYRCINPSASIGDVCYLEGGAYPTSCTAPSPMVRVVPGAELYTSLTAPVLAVSSSGAGSLTCCPIVFP